MRHRMGIFPQGSGFFAERIMDHFDNLSDPTRLSLLERLRDGRDTMAWEDYFRTYWRRMFSFTQRLHCSDTTALHVVQDALIEFFRQSPVYQYVRARGRLRNWLFQVLRRKVALKRRS